MLSGSKGCTGILFDVWKKSQQYNFGQHIANKELLIFAGEKVVTERTFV